MSKKTAPQMTADTILNSSGMVVVTAYISGDAQVGIPDREVHMVFERRLITDIPELRNGLRHDFQLLVMEMFDEPFVRVLYDDECGGCGRVMEPATDGVLECKHCKDHSSES